MWATSSHMAGRKAWERGRKLKTLGKAQIIKENMLGKERKLT